MRLSNGSFTIYDEVHSDFGPPPREFANVEDAIRELRRRAAAPWNREPNRAPCTSWRKCNRRWVLLGESEAIRKEPIWVEVSATGVEWAEETDLRVSG